MATRPAADDIAHRPFESEWPGIVGQNPPDARHRFIHCDRLQDRNSYRMECLSVIQRFSFRFGRVSLAALDNHLSQPLPTAPQPKVWWCEHVSPPLSLRSELFRCGGFDF